jgi:hypothetical protein
MRLFQQVFGGIMFCYLSRFDSARTGCRASVSSVHKINYTRRVRGHQQTDPDTTNAVRGVGD